MKEEIVTIIKTEMVQEKNLLRYIRNMIVSKEVKKMKSEDPATFCELLAFYEESERHNDEVKKIASRLGMSD